MDPCALAHLPGRTSYSVLLLFLREEPNSVVTFVLRRDPAARPTILIGPLIGAMYVLRKCEPAIGISSPRRPREALP